MTTSELAPLAASLTSATFEKGDVLLREDEPPRAFHMLLTGSVTMRRRGRTIRTITAPGGVGFLSLLARTAGGTEAVAEARTETFALRADALEEMFEDFFPVLLSTMRWLGESVVKENLVSPAPGYIQPTHDYDRLIGARELGIVERIFLLRQTLAFKNANVNSIARLARAMKEVRVGAGETLWRPGDRSGGSIFVVKGTMELSWNARKQVQKIGPSYIVGGIESIAGVLRWNELIAQAPCVCLQGSREGLIDMFEDDFDAALTFMSMMAAFLLSLWDRKAERAAGHASTTPTPFTPITPIAPHEPAEGIRIPNP